MKDLLKKARQIKYVDEKGVRFKYTMKELTEIADKEIEEACDVAREDTANTFLKGE